MVIGLGLEDDNYMRFLNDQRQHDDGHIDPLYKIFLEHLKEDGKSYVFDMIDGDCGLPVRVKYEEEDGLSGNMEVDTQTSSCITSFEGRENSVSKSSAQRGSCRKSDEVADLSPVPYNQPESPKADDDYMKFLSHIKFSERHSMVLESDSVTITYETERETPISPDSLVTDEQGIVPYTPTQLIDLTVYQDEDNSSLDYYESNMFRKELMVVLNEPYDQGEYELLLREISQHKPLERVKHLRNMSKAYQTKENGLSYLDHHPDLAKQMWATDDDHRRLILLRGFFFWLKNLCHEGAYKPWESSCYEMITACDYEIIPPLKIARN
ncbi:uncharacterized protein M6B38_311780 [Iris pallida]|uniref:Uncharacterized protein n=1 Tax=Iris pallida TaxID=29817 RepID=A0AAX6HGI9_IRIPA|nr:uncharacterized protein M6B38_311780 [Iris pallida]